MSRLDFKLILFISFYIVDFYQLVIIRLRYSVISSQHLKLINNENNILG